MRLVLAWLMKWYRLQQVPPGPGKARDKHSGKGEVEGWVKHLSRKRPAEGDTTPESDQD